MSTPMQSVSWNQQNRLADLFADAIERRVEYLLVQEPQNVATTLTSFPTTGSAELIVFRDSVDRQRWGRLSDCLAPSVYFLAALPSDHSAVAISVKAVEANPDIVRQSQSLNELAIRLSASLTTAFANDVDANMNDVTIRSASGFRYPPLTMSDSGRGEPWLRELIETSARASNQTSSTDQTALKAGLFLLRDFFDESHSCSQSIEGLGANHTGDYWHAILHRREPDYGNAKYWFRHVGRHPAYEPLARAARRRLSGVQAELASQLQPWASRLVSHKGWDPLMFVDLCEAAERNPELRGWCEEVQYDEMTLLLEATSRDAVGSSQ